jgi:hypothetical protein
VGVFGAVHVDVRFGGVLEDRDDANLVATQTCVFAFVAAYVVTVPMTFFM